MEYKPLVRNNPTDENLTKDHSIWLASRIMPGKGNSKLSVCSPQVCNDAASWTIDFSDFSKKNGLIALDCSLLFNDTHLGFYSDDMINDNYPMRWQGCWVTLGESWVAAFVGHCSNGLGLVAPFNTFNVGYRYKKGWRPQRVS